MKLENPDKTIMNLEALIIGQKSLRDRHQYKLNEWRQDGDTAFNRMVKYDQEINDLLIVIADMEANGRNAATIQVDPIKGERENLKARHEKALTNITQYQDQIHSIKLDHRFINEHGEETYV